jgi:FAD/FMN-containing dehydrogenase
MTGISGGGWTTTLAAAVDDAAAAVTETLRSGVTPATLELLDGLSVEIANAYSDTNLPSCPMLLFEFHAEHDIDTDLETCRVIFERHMASSFDVGQGEELDRMWQARRDLAPAVRDFRPDLHMLTFGDVTVPLSAFPTLVTLVHALADDHGQTLSHQLSLVRRATPDVARGGSPPASSSEWAYRNQARTGPTSGGLDGTIGLVQGRYRFATWGG